MDAREYKGRARKASTVGADPMTSRCQLGVAGPRPTLDQPSAIPGGVSAIGGSSGAGRDYSLHQWDLF